MPRLALLVPLLLPIALVCVAVANVASAQGSVSSQAVEAAGTRAATASTDTQRALDRIREGIPPEPPPEPVPPAAETPVAPAEEAVGVEPSGNEALDRAIEDAERAAEEARQAAEEARAIAEEARAAMQAYRERYARPGFYLGVAASYAIEDFDAGGFNVDNSYSGAIFAGYRINKHLAVEARGEVLDGFDVTRDGTGADALDADLDGFLITAGPKAYPFYGALQPYFGFGLGAFHAEINGRYGDGTRLDRSATDAVFRPAAGVDYFVSENFVLNLEAAYIVAGGDVDDLNFAVFSAGATLRF